MSEEQKLTEEQVREEYRQQRKKIRHLLNVGLTNNDSFYEWCSQYLDYQHITKKKKKKMNDIFESVVDVGSGFILVILIQMFIFCLIYTLAY